MVFEFISAPSRPAFSSQSPETYSKEEGALQIDGVRQGRHDEIRLNTMHADSYGNTRIGSNLILPESTLLDLTAPFIHERCACLYMVVELTLSAGGDSAYVARSTERVDSRVTGISIL